VELQGWINMALLWGLLRWFRLNGRRPTHVESFYRPKVVIQYKAESTPLSNSVSTSTNEW